MRLPTLLPAEMDATLEDRCARLPGYCRQSLIDYLRYGLPPGSFLQAVLSNDLREACRRADEESRYALFDFVFVLYNHAPLDAWGSATEVKAWIERGAALRRAALTR